MAYRILSFDGGGIRGVYTATLLARIAERVPNIAARTDLFAGTSTGSLIALGLAAGLTPQRLQSTYVQQGKDVFDDSWFDDIKDLGQIIGAQYSSKNLKKILTGLFGERRLGALSKNVIIPSFDLDAPPKDGRPRTWKPKFFHNFPGPDSDSGELLVDVAMRSAAAPTYFPAYQGYIDGGVAANNPSVAALAQAVHDETGRQRMEEIRLLSVSTGTNPTFIRGENLDWGFAQWAKPLVALMIDGSMGVSDYECRQFLGSRYHRIGPYLRRAVPLDDAKQIGYLVEEANHVDLDPTVAWIESTFLRD